MAEEFSSLTTQVISKLGYSDSAEDLYDETKVVLTELFDTVKQMEELQWSSRLEDLILALKMYIIAYDRYAAVKKVTTELDTEKLSWKGVSLSRSVCQTLIAIAERLNEKHSYNFFSIYALKQSPGSYSLMDIFRLQEDDRDKKTSKYIDYDSVMQVLFIAVEKAKSTLGFAESKNVRNHPATYTAFSMTIAFALEEIMSTLIAVIDESLLRVNCDIVCEVLLLVANSCPFHRLHPSVFSMLVDFVSRQFDARPARIPRQYVVKLAILLVAQATKFTESEEAGLFSPQPVSLKGVLYTSGSAEESERAGDCPVTASKIVAKSISSLNYWMTCAVLGSESMRTSSDLVFLDIELMIALTKNYFQKFMWDSILCLKTGTHILSFLPVIIATSMQSKNCSFKNVQARVVLQVFQFFVDLALAVSQYLEKYEPVDEGFITCFVQTWDLFFEIAPELMSMDTVGIQKGVSDSFAAFGQGLFERLSPQRQTFTIVSVLGWCRDERSFVRAKGGRCLAHLVGYRILAEDEHFLLDALDAMEENIKNGDHATRTTFSWCLGNYAESLLTHYTDTVPPNFSGQDFERLCELCFACAKDKSKIRYNAHRAIGSLFGWSPDALIEMMDTRSLFEKSLFVLTNQIGSGSDFKARWNASHAMGVVLENEQLIKAHLGALEPVMKHISKVVYKSENYKERIQCIFALTRLRNRDLYSVNFWSVWFGILKSITVPEDIRPSEFAHVEKLKVEACLAICHLISLLQPKDLPELEKCIETSTNLINDVKNSGSVPPEKVHLVNEAIENLKLISSNAASPSYSMEALFESLKELR